MTSPSRGEIWLVDLDSTRGQEIQKTRPVLVVSTNLFAPIPLRIIIPITTWQDKFDSCPFMVKLPATATNRLNRDSAANVLQIRSLSTQRFAKYLGKLEPNLIAEILAGLVICVDYEC
ncbi:type II toxin-antitoxin system PemK/MazF family toxin [Nodosilinea sp. LEGE 07298]|uniref:type II toxin-antitoxin system PemK/MazF family toxin n=1 Tax=Nodosilinea sp. LEGE 07298 TaxID=2777970 RepID=UPI00187F1E41|nr:type II toxin-antitoxin system PemK/MazF family toxin [Nodosilinea sp. LEGE 07298]MBE9113317.1 type II toxin-antitoxin system PemK/MazF family toxin [Nodosilinea sp. LEGE 07298]